MATSYTQDLARGLDATRRDGKFCDAKLIASDGTEFPCHRVVLSAMSKFCEIMFESGMMESETGEVQFEGDNEDCETFLKFIYTGNTDINDENVDILLNVSTSWQIKSLKEACLGYLNKHLSVKNCLRVIELAKFLGMTEIEENAKSLIAKEFAFVSSTDDFLYLRDVDSLLSIFQDKNLNVKTPETICNAAFKWLAMDIENRASYIPRLLDTLHGVSVAPQTMFKMASHFPSLQQLREFQEGCALLHDKQAEIGTVAIFSATDEAIVMIVDKDSSSNADVSCFSFQRKKWYGLPCLPQEPGFNFAICGYGSKLFISGGSNVKTSLLQYDGEANAWSSCPQLPVPKQYHGMVCIEGHLYAIGGCESPGQKPHKEIDVYDINRRTWRKDEKHLHYMVKPVRSFASTRLGKTIYIFGGLDERQEQCSVVQYLDISLNATGYCQQLTLPKELKMQARAVTIENEIYIITKDGTLHNFSPKHERIVEECKIERDAEKSRFPRKGFGVCDWDDRILIFGGEVNFQSRKDMMLYRTEDKVLISMQEELPLPKRDFLYTKISIPKQCLINELGKKKQ